MLDNSVALARCFEDEQTPAVPALPDRLSESGATAPMLRPLEALDGLFAAERHRRLDAARRATLAAFPRELPIRPDTKTADQAWDDTARPAETSRLTIHDAPCLEPAQRRRHPLASLDHDLRNAAIPAGIEVPGQP